MKRIIPWKLVAAHLKKASTLQEETLFQKWISDDENRLLFNEIEQLWAEVQTQVSDCNPDVPYYWDIMKARIDTRSQKKNQQRKALRIVAAAASILLVFGLSFFYFNHINEEMHTYYVMNGKSRIVLPDSSIVWLNSESTINYPGSFRRNRQIDLQGEASFDVKKDDKHPFTVSIYGIKVKVYGTHFNINSYESEENVTVALERGSVSVIVSDKEAFLRPGELAVINKKEHTISIKNADLPLELFWAHESVYFKNKPLGYICKYLEKWYAVKIEVDPEIADTQLYTFTVKDDSLDAILRIMSKINPITYSFDDKKQVKIMKVKP